MKLSDVLQRSHESGDFGEGLTGLPEMAKALELMLDEKQATIDRLISSLKLNVPNCEAAFCNAKATYEYQDYEGTFCKCEKHKGSLYEINDDWNDAVKLIAEIEGHSKYARDE